MTLSVGDIRNILKDVRYPGFSFLVSVPADGPTFLVIEFEATDTKTGEYSRLWRSRKWPLSKHMTRSEVVQTAFAATLMAIEHEARESFKYKGHAIFGPHFDVEALLALAKDPMSEDVRAPAA